MTVVKICGVTSAHDALAALDAGADMLGLNFYPGSPRFVDIDAAAEIVTALPAPTKVIGVFVDASVNRIFRAAERLPLAGVQLHGDESPELIREVMARLPVIKAVRTRAEGERFLTSGCQIMLDAASPMRGGSGQLADWSVAKEIAQLTPSFFLAGGLTPENLAEAVSSVGPYAVDVCSGVELSPRRKSKSALEAFVRAAKTGGLNV